MYIMKGGVKARLGDAALLPVRSMGMMGDACTYRHVLALRAMTPAGGIAAGFDRFPPGLPGHIATRIVNEVKGVNRIASTLDNCEHT